MQVAGRALTAYAESVRIYELQFKHGQTSQMTVAQARSRYETVAARIPRIELQIAQTENVLSVLLGGNPRRFPARPLASMHMPAVPAGLPSACWSAGRTCSRLSGADRRQCTDRRGPGLYFPEHLSLTGAYGSVGWIWIGSVQRDPPGAGELCRTGNRPLFAFGAVSGQVAQARQPSGRQ